MPSFIWTTILPARLVLNAQFRIPYPFLPAISRGLGVPLEVASLLLTVRGLYLSSVKVVDLILSAWHISAMMRSIDR